MYTCTNTESLAGKHIVHGCDVMYICTYMHTHIYTYIKVYGSVGQPTASKSEIKGSTPGISCFSLVLIKN